MEINDESDSAICDRGGALWLADKNVCPWIDKVGVLGLGSSFNDCLLDIRGVVDISTSQFDSEGRMPSRERETSRERSSGPSPFSRRISFVISQISQGVQRG